MFYYFNLTNHSVTPINLRTLENTEPGLPVKLEDSQGNLLHVPSGDGGNVKYYASGWKDFGNAVNGEMTKELLPKEYSFRMSYENISNDKSQDINTNSTVIFTLSGRILY